MKRLILASLLCLGIGCTNLPPLELDCRVLGCSPGDVCLQNPETGKYRCVPETPPPPANCSTKVCPEGQLCAETPEGPTCYTPPPPIPVCPESCPAGTACTDPAVGCVPVEPPPQPTCVIPPDQGWTATSGAPTKTSLLVEGQQALGDRCGRTQHASLLLLVGWLNGRGECSAAFGEDYVMIRVGPGPKHEEYDVLLGNGCWRNPNYSGTWLPPGEEPPPPPPATTCSGIPRVGRFRFGSHPVPCAVGRLCDVDPLAPGVEGADWNGTVIRGWCDAQGRPGLWCTYGAAAGTPGRVEAEQCGIGGDGKIVWRSDGQLTIPEENPIHAGASCVSCTWLEACAADGATGCSRYTFPQ